MCGQQVLVDCCRLLSIAVSVFGDDRVEVCGFFKFLLVRLKLNDPLLSWFVGIKDNGGI